MKILRVLGIAGVAVGVLAYPLAFGIDRAAGVEVIIVQAADPASVETNRGLWDLNGKELAEVPGIYGTPSKGTSRIVFAKEEDLLRPKEDPSRTLFLKKTGNKELQSQTLYFFALYSTVGGLVAGALLLWLGCRKGCCKAGNSPRS